MTQRYPLYFIAWVPGSPVQEEVTRMKREIESQFGARHALKAPAHITIIPPFRASNEKITKVSDAIEVICANANRFAVELHGFDAFEPRVLFVDVGENGELTEICRRVVDRLMPLISDGNKRDLSRPLHPHVTIANRDLSEKAFYEAYPVYRERHYYREVVVDTLSVLKHNGQEWDVWRNYHFRD